MILCSQIEVLIEYLQGKLHKSKKKKTLGYTPFMHIT